MSLRVSRLFLLPFTFVLLSSCASKPDVGAPLSVSNTRGTTVVNGIEVAYTYDGQFYVLAEDMLFYSLEDLRTYVAYPFGSEGDAGTQQAPGGETSQSFLVPGRQWLGNTIPFQIQSYSPGSAKYNSIVRAIEHWQQRTLIRFIPSSGSGLRLVFREVPGNDCFGNAGIGRPDPSNPVLPVNLSSACVATSDSLDYVVKHEIGHAVGFFHEHQRADREQYVDYYEGNVRSGSTDAFTPIFSTGVSFTGYDYNSLMHYFRTTFSRNGQPTLTRKGDYNYGLGSYNLSNADIYSTERYYMGETKCGQEQGVNNCRYKAYSLSSTSPVVYFEFSNTKNLCQYAGYMLSNDWHPDNSRVDLTYEFELQVRNSNGTWTTKKKVGPINGGWLKITFGLAPGTYRWVYRHVSGRGYIDTYRTDQARCP